MCGSVYLFKSNVGTEKYAYIKYMYGEFLQNEDIHVTSIILKKEKKKQVITNIQKPLLLFEGRGRGCRRVL